MWRHALRAISSAGTPVAEARAQGGNPMISFGGHANSELAVGCTSVPALTAAYLAPVQRYHAHVIDLDIEGPDLANQQRTPVMDFGPPEADMIGPVKSALTAAHQQLGYHERPSSGALRFGGAS